MTPTFTLDLSGSPNASSVTPTASRNGTCCGGSVPCVKIVVLLNPLAMALKLTPTGADPGGALTYEFNCDGNQIPGGTPICLPNGTGSATLTICKVGNNANSYSVESIPRPDVPDSVFVRNGCTQTLVATGFAVPTISWTALNSGTNTALYNSYLSCTSGCATVVVTPTNTPPPSVLYQVSGNGVSPCGSNFYSDTVRVYFYSDLTVALSNTAICFGTSTTVLTATASGGKPPLTYSWMPSGLTGSSVVVGQGTHTVIVQDQTNCPPVFATATVTQFTVAITADAGNNRALCKTSPNVSLSGTVTGVTTGSWSSSGTGTFNPSNSALNATFVPDAAVVNSGSVQIYLTTTNNQGCVPGTHTIDVTFQNPPLITAMPDQTVCANNAVTSLSGIITNFSATPLWSSTGTGTFSSITNSNTTFTPGTTAINNGSVGIVLTTTNNGVCPAATGSMVIHITPRPVVNAGADFTICSNSSAALNGSVTVATTTGSWSTLGDGTFSNASSLVSSYTPGSGDIVIGSTTLILTSTNNGNCLPERDTLRLSIRHNATVSIGAMNPICSNASGTTLSSTITGATNTGSWSTSGSGSFNNVNSLSPTYSISNGDRSQGVVNFTITSTNNGVCPAVSASGSLSIVPIATVNAGPSQTVCSSQNTIALTGSVTSPPGNGQWATGGTGFFTSSSGLNATYSMSAGDINNGSVVFILASTNNGVCPAVSNSVTMNIVRIPVVNAGSNTPVCSTATAITLSGSVTSAAGTGSWSSSGSGPFTGGSSNLNTSYSLTPTDISNGFVTFTLGSTNNGVCGQEADTVMVTVRPMAVALAGTAQSICSSTGSISLGTGSPTLNSLSGTGIWTTNGTGTLQNNTAIFGASYSISPADINSGSVIFTLSSTNNGICPAASSTVMLSITKLATVNAGPGSPICSSSSVIVLTGSVSSTMNTGVWNGGNNSTGYSPSNSAMTVTYTIDNTDIANGSVTFTLSSTNDGPCPIRVSTVQVQIFSVAGVTAGLNQVLCSSQNSIQLNGVVLSSASTGSWNASGTGSFSPSNSNLGTNYILTPADIINGVVNFTLSATNNGPCPVATSTLSASVVKQAVVSVSGPSAVCTTTLTVPLSGTVNGGSSSGVWISSGSGAFNPSNITLNTNYTISPSDITAGSVLITLLSTNDGPCAQAKDTLRIDIKAPPTASSGTYSPICSSQGSLQLNGVITGASGTGSWTSNGTGIFSPSGTDLSTFYFFSASDIQNGVVIFTLTSTGNGGCPAAANSANLLIRKQPTVEAGPEKTICSTQKLVALNGQVFGISTSGSWSSSGNGSYSPSNSLLNTSYSVTTADVAKGSVIFTLTSTNNDVCPAASDTVKLIIVKMPVLTIKADSTICEKQTLILLQPQVSGLLNGVQWLSTGSGKFLPNNFNYPVSYSLSPQDLKNGSVTLTIASPSNSACGNLQASMRIYINPSPKAAFAVSIQTITLPADPITLTNQSSGASSYKWDFGDGRTSIVELQTLSHGYTEVGFYTITLVAVNQFDCSDTTEKTIVVIKDVQFPTAFTPNGIGDAVNETFAPFTGGVVEYDLMIFNRWGELIFHSKDVTQGWDGTFNGKPCQQDAYVWKADIKFFDGRTFNKTGSITLLR